MGTARPGISWTCRRSRSTTLLRACIPMSVNIPHQLNSTRLQAGCSAENHQNLNKSRSFQSRFSNAEVRLSSPRQAAWFAWTPGGRGHAHAHRHTPVARLPRHHGLIVWNSWPETLELMAWPAAPSRRTQRTFPSLATPRCRTRVHANASATPGADGNASTTHHATVVSY